MVIKTIDLNIRHMYLCQIIFNNFNVGTKLKVGRGRINLLKCFATILNAYIMFNSASVEKNRGIRIDSFKNVSLFSRN